MATHVLSHPLTISANDGGFVKVEQGSDIYKGQQLASFIRTHPDERPVFPEYGTDDPTFTPFDAETFAERFRSFYDADSIEMEDVDIVQSASAAFQINVTFK